MLYLWKIKYLWRTYRLQNEFTHTFNYIMETRLITAFIHRKIKRWRVSHFFQFYILIKIHLSCSTKKDNYSSRKIDWSLKSLRKKTCHIHSKYGIYGYTWKFRVDCPRPRNLSGIWFQMRSKIFFKLKLEFS